MQQDVAKMGQDGAIWAITRGTRCIGTTISPEVGVAGGGKEGVNPLQTTKTINNKQASLGSNTACAKGPANSILYRSK